MLDVLVFGGMAVNDGAARLIREARQLGTVASAARRLNFDAGREAGLTETSEQRA
jgi:hypothetical protein